MNTVIDILSNVDFDNSYNNVLDFVSRETQEAYFDTKIALTYENYATVRANKEITVGGSINDLRNYSYCRYSNTIDGVEKTFYAFIVKKEYVNPTATKLFLEVDVWQTYMFDYEIKESYIEREHQNRFDTSLNLIINDKEENIDIGNTYQKLNDVTVKKEATDKVGCALIISTKPIETGGTMVQNVSGPTNSLPDPLCYYIIPYIKRFADTIYLTSTSFPCLQLGMLSNDIAGNNTTGPEEVINQRTLYSNIIDIVILPYLPFDYTVAGNIITSTVTKVSVKYSSPNTPLTTEEKFLYRLSGVTLIDTLKELNIKDLLGIPEITLDINNLKNIDYEPKLYSYPFKYLTLDCNQIEPLIIKPQYLENLETLNIKFNQSIGITPITKYYVENYKGDTGSDTTLINNTQNNITVATSKLLDYLGQNRASAISGLAVNTGLNILQAGLGMATNSAFGAVSAIESGISIFRNIYNENMKRKDLEQGSPNFKARGNNIYAYIQQYTSNDGLRVRTYGITSQFRNFVFNYLYHYGYKCNDFIIPNLQSRYYFNYIKTIGVNLTANLDNEIIVKLKSIYDNGVTIWHWRSAETFKGIYNYAYENLEMTIYGGA